MERLSIQRLIRSRFNLLQLHQCYGAVWHFDRMSDTRSQDAYACNGVPVNVFESAQISVVRIRVRRVACHRGSSIGT
jgi:hypothetical protein